MNELKLGTIERQQIAYYFYAEDFRPQELSTMYEISIFRVERAIKEYKSWYI